MADPQPPEEITFVGYRRPVLPTGDYDITVEQTLSLDPQTFSASRQFTVSAERFALAPSAVRAVFPPDGSLGDHSTVLPHIVLDRPTLPWERLPGGSAEGPWLVLLLFAEAERPEPQVITLGELAGSTPYFPALTLERHQAAQDRVSVIDVPQGLLAELLPTADELPYLAHVRRGDGGDAAVVIGNRLPKAGGSSTVHLVSIEGRFRDVGQGRRPQFDLGSGEPTSPVRLVTLASWRFACVDSNQTFPTLVRDLARAGHPFRLPDSGSPDADAFLREGFVPVRHTLRSGGRTVAWYRGPFATGPVDGGPPVGVRSSDRLLRYHPDAGMFDVSYAAAWELGRLLALESSGFSTELYEWKRRRSQARLRSAREPESGYPLSVPDIDDTLPERVTAWLTRLSRLGGVPLGYLVPDERLLPVEAIRFVTLDQAWVRCLVDGAYSIGRLGETDAELDSVFPLPRADGQVTGALVRSDVVSGYPDLLVDGYADADGTTALPIFRLERLSSNILLCLFTGVLARLDIHQRPESLHFAVELPAPGTFAKSLRDAAGGDGPSVGPLDLSDLGTIPIDRLAARMATALRLNPRDFGSGDFARQMIETAERVSFLGSQPA